MEISRQRADLGASLVVCAERSLDAALIRRTVKMRRFAGVNAGCGVRRRDLDAVDNFAFESGEARKIQHTGSGAARAVRRSVALRAGSRVAPAVCMVVVVELGLIGVYSQGQSSPS